MQLYSAEILSHVAKPFHNQKIAGATHEIRQSNALCGDRVHWTLQCSSTHVVALGQETRGCAICIASASMLAEKAYGRARTPLLKEIDDFILEIERIVQGEETTKPMAGAFSGVVHAPMRKECVWLPWQSFQRLFDKKVGER